MFLKIIIFSIILSNFVLIPDAFAQSEFFGTPADQILKIQLDEKNNAVVTHELKSGGGKVFIQFLNESYSELRVMNVNNQFIEFGEAGFDEKFGITISNAHRGDKIEYSIKNVMSEKNGIMQWEFFYPIDSIFIFPEIIETIYVNENRVDISQAKAINCHGCQMKLEYIVDEPTIIKHAEWETEKFPVIFQTLTNISNFHFEQESKSISFEINSGSVPITVKIPKELLWNPYEVYLDNEKIEKREINLDESNVLLHIRPHQAGVIQIIGISAIPEFPIFAPLVIGIIIVITLQIKQRINFNF